MTNAEDLFTQALRLSPDERTDWLERVCGYNQELQSRVHELLQAQNEIDSQFLEGPAKELEATLLGPVSESSGTEIGPYKLREQLGEGGMGTVFVADQKEIVATQSSPATMSSANGCKTLGRTWISRVATAEAVYRGLERIS